MTLTPSPKQQIRNYGVAVASVLIALVVMLALNPLIQLTNTPFLLFFGATTLAALYGGQKAGWLASLLSAVCANYFFIEPIFQLEWTFANVAKTVVFILQGCVISVLVGSLRTTQQKSERILWERDRTEIKVQQLTYQLMQRVNELQTLFDLLPIGVAIAEDPSCTVVRSNQWMSRITRVPAGRTASQGASPGERPPYRLCRDGQEIPIDRLPMQYAAAHNVEVRDELIDLVHPDGTVYKLLFYASPLQDEQGNVRGVLGAFVDITQRSRIEAQLRSNEERLNLAVSGAGMATWDVDLRTGKAIWSENHFTLLGYDPQSIREVSDELWSSRVHPDDATAVMQAVEQAKQARSLCRVEYRIIRADNGETRWLSASARFLYDPAGQAIRFIGIFFDLTDRKAADLEIQRLNRDLTLRASELQTILDVLPVGVGIAEDPECKSVRVNRFGQTMLTVPTDANVSITSEAAESLPFRLFRNGQAIPASELPMELAIAQQQTVRDMEIQMVRSDGVSLDWWVSTVPLLDEQGAVRGCVSAFMNVTELKNERARFEAVLRQLPEGVMIADASSGSLVLSNEQANRILRYDYALGFRLEEYSSKVPFVRYHLNGQPYQSNEYPLARSLQTGEVVCHEEAEIRFEDGSRIFLDINSSPVFNRQGHVISAVTVFQDITERKQIEAALQQTNDRFYAAMRAVDGIVFEWNIETQLVYRSEGLLQLVGVRPEDAPSTQQWWLDRIHPDDRKRFEVEVSTILANADRYEEEYRVWHEAGRWVDVWERGCLQRNAAGHLVRVIGFTTDVTNRKQIAAEREQLLQREQAAREEAERANRLKDEFLAVLSHELRSPLNPILGWTKLLRSRRFDETRQQEALATIERNAKLQTQLIEDLLDISRIMRGKLTLNNAPVNLAFVISAAIETVQLAAEAKQINLEIDLASTVAPVWGDVARLQQVVWNLLSNAVKFTPTAGRITVQLHQIEQQVQIRVIDTGKGIAPQFISHVFDYFRQEDGSTTRKFGGLGLGLAIARQIVEMHGGHIWAESAGENQGATFTVQLPITQPALPFECEPDANSPEFAMVPLNSLKILLVDDEDDTREFVVAALEQSGATVAAVSCGSDALQLLDQEIPDVIVSDIGMAEMDGYMLMRQIRSRAPDQGGTVPAIALTAYATEADQDQAYTAGFQRHLSKPIDPATLVEAIVQVTGSGDISHVSCG